MLHPQDPGEHSQGPQVQVPHGLQDQGVQAGKGRTKVEKVKVVYFGLFINRVNDREKDPKPKRRKTTVSDQEGEDWLGGGQEKCCLSCLYSRCDLT